MCIFYTQRTQCSCCSPLLRKKKQKNSWRRHVVSYTPRERHENRKKGDERERERREEEREREREREEAEATNRKSAFLFWCINCILVYGDTLEDQRKIRLLRLLQKERKYTQLLTSPGEANPPLSLSLSLSLSLCLSITRSSSLPSIPTMRHLEWRRNCKTKKGRTEQNRTGFLEYINANFALFAPKKLL